MPAKKCAECGHPLNTQPRYATKPTKGARTWQRDIWRAADRLETPLMAWQKRGARLIGELRPDGLPRFKTIGVSVPRQQGKTTLSKSGITAKAESAEKLKIFGTAQTRSYAVKHLLSLGEDLAPDVGMHRAGGREKLTWANGTVYATIAPDEKGGHGDSIDWLLVDEGWTLTDEVMGGIRPAMVARPMSQIVIVSTMGTVDSHTWNRLVARGRESVEDPDATIAWLEYSAPTDDAIFDESTWHSFMPALGITVSHESIRAAMDDMEPAEIIRAFGNRTTKSMVSIWPSDWIAKAWRVIQPPERFVLALDVNDEPAGASVATGHLTDEGTATRVTEWRYGSPRWVPDYVKKMIAHRSVVAVVADFGGPSKQIEADVRAVCDEAFIPVVDRKPREVASDTQRLYDALRESRAVMERSETLEEAIQGSQRKYVGDMWLISRRQMTMDASPIIATVLAHGYAEEENVSPVVDAVYMAW